MLTNSIRQSGPAPEHSALQLLPQLSESLYLDDLIEVFASIVTLEGGAGHRVVIEEPQGSRPLFACAVLTADADLHSSGSCERFAFTGPGEERLELQVLGARGFLGVDNRSRITLLGAFYVQNAIPLLRVDDEGPGDQLSARELEILRRMISGCSSHLDIGFEMGLCPHSVGVLLRRAGRKLNAPDVNRTLSLEASRGLLQED